MEDYHDHFDIPDDKNDSIDFNSEELNQYFTSGYLYTMLNEQYYQQEEEEEPPPPEMMAIDPSNDVSIQTVQVRVFLV